MSVLRRALAVLPAAALAATAPSAHAAEIKTLPCVPYVLGQKTMPVVGTGFTPNGFVSVLTNTTANPTPSTLTSSQVDATGGFQTTALPPAFSPSSRHLQTFNLIAEDRANPAAPIGATSQFQVVRFGLTRTPNPRRPRQRVTYTARGFIPGKPVYVHFRYAGVTRRTVRLGIAKAPCGIVSKRMRALPTKVRYGSWRGYADQSKRFSKSTRPQWIDPFRITRIIG